nr:MAG TPA: hypothetical protein [Caudoviricetes sp.]
MDAALAARAEVTLLPVDFAILLLSSICKHYTTY